MAEEIKTAHDLCVALEKCGISKEESLEALVEGIRREIVADYRLPPELLMGII